MKTKAIKFGELDKGLQDAFKHIYKMAAHNLSNSGNLQPVAIYSQYNPATKKSENGVIVGLEMPNSQEGKDAIAQLMKSFGYRFKANLLFTIFEAWSVKPTREQEKLPAKELEKEMCKTPIRLNPDRIEVVMISMEVKGIGMFSCCTEITRDEDGKPSISEEMPKIEDFHTAGGRFAGILEYNPKHPSPFELGLSETPDNPRLGMKKFDAKGEEVHEQDPSKN